MDGLVRIFCLEHGMKAPIVSYDTSKFLDDSKTVLCESDGSVIYIKRYTEAELKQMKSIGNIMYLKEGVCTNYEQCYELFHELRRLWQTQSGDDSFFSECKSVNDNVNIRVFDQYKSEVDANAYAARTSNLYFAVETDFEGFDEKLKQDIIENMAEVERQTVRRECAVEIDLSMCENCTGEVDCEHCELNPDYDETKRHEYYMINGQRVDKEEYEKYDECDEYKFDEDECEEER